IRPAGRKRIPVMTTTFSLITADTMTHFTLLAIGKSATSLSRHFLLHLISQQDCFCYFAHGFAVIHTRLLYLTEGILLAQPLFFHQETFGSLHNLTRLQLFGQGARLLFERAKFIIASQRYFNGRRNFALSQRLHDIIHHTCLFGAVDQRLVAKGSEQQHWCNLLLGESLGGSNAVHIRHPDIHYDQVRSKLAREVDGAQSITCLTYHKIALLGQYVFEIHSLNGLIISDYNSCRHMYPLD